MLHNVTVHVPERQGIAVVGPNGAGKTTLLRSILGAFGVSVRGTVHLGGIRIDGLATYAIARLGVAFVPAERRVLPLSVEENFRIAAMGGSWRQEVESLSSYFPFLERLLRRRGDLLSGGEQQAVAIVRGCLSRPRYLLLDEPTEGLAPRAVDGIIELLGHVQQQRGTSIVLTERSSDVAESLGLQTIVLERGVLLT